MRTGMNQPWPLRDVVRKLADFATQELDRGYDGHGWEEVAAARDAAQEAWERDRRSGPHPQSERDRTPEELFKAGYMAGLPPYNPPLRFVEPEGVRNANCAYCWRLLPRAELDWTGQTYVCADEKACQQAVWDRHGEDTYYTNEGVIGVVPEEDLPPKHVWILTDRDLNDALDLKNDPRYGSNDAVMRYLERRQKGAWL